MAIGTSIFLIAVGAILTFAVDYEVEGLDIAAVGIILMIAGVIGMVVSLFWMDRFTAPRRTAPPARRPARRPVADDRTDVIEETEVRRTDER